MKRKKLEAFPGDGYIEELKNSSKTKRSWVALLVVFMLIAASADFFILVDMISTLLHTDPSGMNYDNWFEGLVNGSKSFLIPLALVCSTLGVARVAGAKKKEYKAFGEESSRTIFITMVVIEIAIMSIVAVVRYQATITDPKMAESYGDNLLAIAFWESVLLTTIMAASALLSALGTYYSGDALAERKLLDGAIYVPEDAMLYEDTYYQYAADDVKDREYEAQERALDEEAVQSVFRLGSLASQLNGMLDPADVHDFRTASRLASDYYYNSTVEEG